jgi:hypothetical protein
MDENILSWNVTNWITVLLMVAIGYAGLGWLQRLWVSRQAQGPTLARAA